MSDEIVSKMAVSVTEMARMVGLSRARFYQLVRAGTFPPPDREPATERPCYCEEKQRTCLEVRRRNCGIDGRPILFYSRRRDFGTKKPKPAKPKLEAKRGDVAALLDGLNALGLTTATAAQVQQVIDEKYPSGTAGMDHCEVLKAVFLEIRRRNLGGSDGGK
jgi:plasmid maintenance system antidote protein VapI